KTQDSGRPVLFERCRAVRETLGWIYAASTWPLPRPPWPLGGGSGVVVVVVGGGGGCVVVVVEVDVVGGSGIGNGVMQPFGPAYEGAGHAGAVTVVSPVTTVVAVVSPAGAVAAVVDVVVGSAGFSGLLSLLAGRGRSMPTWDTMSATGFWATEGRAPAAARPPKSTVRPAALAATSLGS